MLKKALMVAALGIATTSAFAVDVERVEKSIVSTRRTHLPPSA